MTSQEILPKPVCRVLSLMVENSSTADMATMPLVFPKRRAELLLCVLQAEEPSGNIYYTTSKGPFDAEAVGPIAEQFDTAIREIALKDNPDPTCVATFTAATPAEHTTSGKYNQTFYPWRNLNHLQRPPETLRPALLAAKKDFPRKKEPFRQETVPFLLS